MVTLIGAYLPDGFVLVSTWYYILWQKNATLYAYLVSAPSESIIAQIILVFLPIHDICLLLIGSISSSSIKRALLYSISLSDYLK